MNDFIRDFNNNILLIRLSVTAANLNRLPDFGRRHSHCHSLMEQLTRSERSGIILRCL